MASLQRLLLIIVVGGFGGQAMSVTIAQTLVCEFSIPVNRSLIVRPDHSVYYRPWAGHAGLKTIGPWSQAKRSCTGGKPL
jgi:hypothetical protein